MTLRGKRNLKRGIAICALSLLCSTIIWTLTFLILFFPELRDSGGRPASKGLILLAVHAIDGVVHFGVAAMPIFLTTLWTRKLWPGFALTVGPVAALQIYNCLTISSVGGIDTNVPPQFVLLATTFITIFCAPPRAPLIGPEHCDACGYDMHAANSTRCPECGLLRRRAKGPDDPDEDISIRRRFELWFIGAAISGATYFGLLFLVAQIL